ncbi:MAG: heparan-alpha-glucosaminide N-acetyltransferase domain-containing protein [Planctomycetales bacterium]
MSKGPAVLLPDDPLQSRAAAPPRLMSLDALRGFDMFMIVGADAIVGALNKLVQGSSETPLTSGVKFIATQLSHVSWEGLRFYDLIFPLFVFMTGMSLVFSLRRMIEQEGRNKAIQRVILRGVLLYLMGLYYYGLWDRGVANVRLLGVLQRIAICYLVTGLLFIFLQTRGLVIACVVLLVGYWAMMTYIPVPGVGAGNFEEGKNLANYIDQQYLPLRRYDKTHDPEGLLSTLPAIGTCLLGVFAGLLMRSPKYSPIGKVGWLVLMGVLYALVGHWWGGDLGPLFTKMGISDPLAGHYFPIIKKIWTSSYVLAAAGYSCLMMALFHLIIEVFGFRIWAWPFVWIGVNPLLIYMSERWTDWHVLVKPILGGPVETMLGNYAPLVTTCAATLLIFLFARFLFVRRIFLRL